jgi:Tfp pilus assembly protein PilZ
VRKLEQNAFNHEPRSLHSISVPKRHVEEVAMERTSSQSVAPVNANELANRQEPVSGEHPIDLTPRTRLFAQVDLHTQSNFFSGFSGTLIDGGLFVATYEPLELGQPVHVEFSLPGGALLACDGYVSWLCDPLHLDHDLAPGAGVVFEHVDPSLQNAVARFMQRREPLFHLSELE